MRSTVAELVGRLVEDDKPSVFAEIVSDLVSIDVNFYAPNEESTCWTLVTAGMADRPMHPAAGQGGGGDRADGGDGANADQRTDLYAELTLALPRHWPVGEEAFEDEANYWPVRLLRRIARYPHESGTAIGPGQLLAFGDPAQPLDPAGEYNAVLIGVPMLLGDEAVDPVPLPDGRSVHILSVIPLRPAEYAFALEEGMDALIDAITDLADRNPFNELTEFLNRDRPDLV